MTGFWIAGIVVNVSLTALAIYWVLRNMKPRADKPDPEQKPSDSRDDGHT